MKPHWVHCFLKAYFWIPFAFVANSYAADVDYRNLHYTSAPMPLTRPQEKAWNLNKNNHQDTMENLKSGWTTTPEKPKQANPKKITPTTLNASTVSNIIWSIRGHLQYHKPDEMKRLNNICSRVSPNKFDDRWSPKTQKSFSAFNDFYYKDSRLNGELAYFSKNKVVNSANYADPKKLRHQGGHLFSRTLSSRDLYSLAILAAYQYKVTGSEEKTLDSLLKVLKDSYAAVKDSDADIHQVAYDRNHAWSLYDEGSIGWRCMLAMNFDKDIPKIADLVSKSLQCMKPLSKKSVQPKYCP